MNIHKPGITISAAALLAAVALGSCSAGSVSAVAPPGGVAQPAGHGIHPLATVSTRVNVRNVSAITVSPSYTLGCWSLSTSFPTLAPGTFSGVVTETYNLACGASSTLDITYGSPDCTFRTAYNSGFSYSAINSAGTACSVATSMNVTYDELFTYNTTSARIRNGSNRSNHH
jgi:hypothetical protein